MLPKEVTVLGITYRVEEVEYISKEAFRIGEINYTEQVIKIDRSLSEQKKGQVFMHELIHAVLDELGMSDWSANEHAVQNLAAVLYHVFSSQAICPSCPWKGSEKEQKQTE